MKTRRSPRLKEFDYAQNGAYFLTICSQQRINYFSTIDGEELKLTSIGKIIKEQVSCIESRFKNAKVPLFVIMPNHIHLILEIDQKGGASPAPTVSSIIGAFKSITSRIIKDKYGIEKLYQRSFYDHVIRDVEDYNKRANYILENPLKWTLDELYNE